MKSAALKRSIRLDGRKTSISLEDVFWTELKEIAHFQGVTVSSLVTAIAARTQGSLSSAIRVFVVEHLRNKDKRTSPPHTVSAASSDESRSPQAWRWFAKRG
jgi:predicted DNA-binding ribbon-helix-helix protein